MSEKMFSVPGSACQFPHEWEARVHWCVVNMPWATGEAYDVEREAMNLMFGGTPSPSDYAAQSALSDALLDCSEDRDDWTLWARYRKLVDLAH